MPRYPGGQTLDYGQAYQLVAAQGGSPAEADVLARIAGPESGYYTRNVNENVSTGDNSWGLWQINMLGAMGDQRLRAYGLSSKQDLWDPMTNARIALDLLRGQGTRAWTNTARALGIPLTNKGIPGGYVPTGGGSSGGGNTSVGLGDALAGTPLGALGSIVDQFNPVNAVSDFVTGVGQDIVQGLFRLAAYGTLLAAGGALIVLGAWRSVSSSSAASSAKDAAMTAAVAA